jgi:hypothetical protein
MRRERIDDGHIPVLVVDDEHRTSVGQEDRRHLAARWDIDDLGSAQRGRRSFGRRKHRPEDRSRSDDHREHRNHDGDVPSPTDGPFICSRWRQAGVGF